MHIENFKLKIADRSSRGLRAMCKLQLLVLLAGCAAPRVNVPPLPGDLASHDPNGSGVLAVQVAALRHVLRDWPPQRSAGNDGEPGYAVVLPEGTTDKSYHRVLSQLPPGSTSDRAAGLPTYTVAQVHMRGPHARVDVIKPDDVGGEQLVSAFGAIDISGWYIRRSKLWNIPVDQALRITRSAGDETPPSERGEE